MIGGVEPQCIVGEEETRCLERKRSIVELDAEGAGLELWEKCRSLDARVMQSPLLFDRCWYAPRPRLFCFLLLRRDSEDNNSYH